MSERSDKELLQDIKEAASRIKSYTAKISYETFLSDTKTQDAVVRNLEIIGEASKKLSTQFKKKHPGIPWQKISGMRDRLIHDYSGVNLDIVWTVTDEELPSLSAKITKILQSI
jgi:uncharacterized protein with HEPN domain